MDKKIIVWDLFGGGHNSIYNALKQCDMLNDFDIYTFDITNPVHEKQFKVNLAQKNLIDFFAKFPKPDIITASPLCQSFSVILSMKTGGTCFWKLNYKKNKLVFRTIKEFEHLKSGFTKNLNAQTQKFIAQLGKKCINNTIYLIKFFKPKYWYIENPKSSLMWKFIVLNRKDFFNPEIHFFNEASYGKYGFLSAKRTYFLSNIKMNLKKGSCPKKYFIHNNNLNLFEFPNIKIKIGKTDRSSKLLDLEEIKKIADKNQGFIKIPKKTQKNKMTDFQISEANLSSSIPKKLIIDIFKHFYPEIFLKQNQHLDIYIQEKLFRSV